MKSLGLSSLSFLITFLIIPPMAAFILHANEPSSIVKFCKRNGKRYLNLFTIDEQDPNITKAVADFMFASKKEKSIYTRKVMDINFEDMRLDSGSESLNFYRDSLIILASTTDTSNWKQYLEAMTKTRMKPTKVSDEPSEKLKN